MIEDCKAAKGSGLVRVACAEADEEAAAEGGEGPEGEERLRVVCIQVDFN